MTFKKTSMNLSALSLAVAAATLSLAAPQTARAELSANVGVVSQYIFRGGVENGDAAVQGGIDYALPAGFYVGYWGSSLGDPAYSNATGTPFENDIYAGWSKEFGPVTLDVGLLYYLYSKNAAGPGAEADVLEPYVKATLGPATLAVHYFAWDANWGNGGDVYLALSGEHSFGKVTLGATLGYSLYDDGGNTKGGPGTATTESSNFRHLDVKGSVPITDQASMSLTYVLGGKDRFDADIANQIVLGFNYSFDVK